MRVNDLSAERGVGSETRTTNGYVPAVVGVPEIVFPASARPGGS
jgi:hypothetical protein